MPTSEFSVPRRGARWRSQSCRCCGEPVSMCTVPGKVPTAFDHVGGPRHRCGRGVRWCDCGEFLYTRNRDGAVLRVADDLPHTCGQARRGIVVPLVVRVQPERTVARDTSSLRPEPEAPAAPERRLSDELAL